MASRSPSPGMLAVLRELATRGGQVASRYEIPGYGGRSRVHGNVWSALEAGGYVARRPRHADGLAGGRPVQITTAGWTVLDTGDRLSGIAGDVMRWREFAIRVAHDAAVLEHRRHQPTTSAVETVDADGPKTMLALVHDLTLAWYTAGRSGVPVVYAADAGMDAHREIARRLDAVQRFLGTEATKIKSILDGRAPS